eukprot:COSAG02_NODE_4734_length_5038_cov_120.236485_4_plen_79_part_00
MRCNRRVQTGRYIITPPPPSLRIDLVCFTVFYSYYAMPNGTIRRSVFRNMAIINDLHYAIHLSQGLVRMTTCDSYCKK